MSTTPAPYLRGGSGIISTGVSTYIPTAASGGVAPFGLLDILTVSGNTYFWSDQRGVFAAAVAGEAENVQYQGWLAGRPKFQRTGTTQTDTGSVSIQNISGNTVQRDVALAFSRAEFIGALVIYRLWHAAAESALFSFTGNVTGADVDETQMDLTLEGFGNYSAITAPAFNIDVSCGLNFGGIACGSTANVPCNQSYGTCSSIERFMGVIIQWDSINSDPPLVQIAQPVPAAARNPARAF